MFYGIIKNSLVPSSKATALIGQYAYSVIVGFSF
jgi:hypothetical protein